MSAPRIVVLDGYCLNPGDLGWEALSKLGKLEVFERTSPEDVIERARGARIVLTNKALLPRAAFEALPELQLVSVLATGTNVVDLEAARDHGVVVCNVPLYSTASTAQAAIALLLELTNQVGAHDRNVRERWSRCPDFSYTETPLTELDGKVLGVVGFGAIGQRVSRIGAALGMQVVSHTRTPKQDREVQFVGLDALLGMSDVVSLHCPLTEATERLINADRLSLMKRGALLINTARGPLLDEAAVAAALHSGKLGGAGLDVLSTEPPAPDNPLLSAPNCIITPHLAWATRASRERMLKESARNVKAFLDGTPIHVCT